MQRLNESSLVVSFDRAFRQWTTFRHDVRSFASQTPLRMTAVGYCSTLVRSIAPLLVMEKEHRRSPMRRGASDPSLSFAPAPSPRCEVGLRNALSSKLHFAVARVAIAILLLFTVLSPAAEPVLSPKVADRLKQLETKLSSVRTLKVNFVQEKEMAILENKLILKGRITLQQPDKVAWRVHSPVRYGLCIDGPTLRQWSEDTGSVSQISLAGNPIFTAAVKQIQSWFSGNYTGLAKEFNIALLQDSPLIVQFTPRATSPTREMIRRIVMRFGSDERYLKSMEVDEAGGDKMRIAFSDTVVNPVLSKADWDVKSND